MSLAVVSESLLEANKLSLDDLASTLGDLHSVKLIMVIFIFNQVTTKLGYLMIRLLKMALIILTKGLVSEQFMAKKPVLLMLTN